MENRNTTVGCSNTSVFPDGILSRLAFGGGVVLIAGATGYMNIAGWVAQAGDQTGAWVNGALATDMELGAAGGLAWAAHQTGQRRPLRAAFAAAAGATLIYFNTLAAQNFIRVQHQRGTANASEAAQTVEDAATQIAQRQRELSAIERENGGDIPRPVAALDAAAKGLQPERRRDAATLRRLGEEKALRIAYDDAQTQIVSLRAQKRSENRTAKHEVHTVMSADMVVPFIWAMEILKGSIFFILGGSDLGAIFRRANKPAKTPEPPKPKPKQTRAERAQWARIKNQAKRGARGLGSLIR